MEPTAQPTLAGQDARVHPAHHAAHQRLGADAAAAHAAGRTTPRPQRCTACCHDSPQHNILRHPQLPDNAHARTHHARHARHMSTRPGQSSRGARATRATARAITTQSPRQTRSRSRHGHEVATKVTRSRGHARRPGTHNPTTLPAPSDNADGTRAGGIPRQRTASAPMPTAATGTTLRSLTPSWAACAVWSAAERMPSWAYK